MIFQVPNIFDEAIEIVPGYQYTIKVTPTMVKTSEETMKLPENVRQCKGNGDKHELKLFRNYS
jgi:hypothetical protein